MTDKPPEPPAVVQPSAKELELEQKLKTLQDQVDAAAKRPARRAAAAPPATTTAKTPQQELEDFANSKAREVEVLRTAQQYGLTEDELLADDVEFANPTELKLKAQLLAQDKKQKALDTSITEQAKLLAEIKKLQGGGDEGSEGKSDAGGRTRRVAQEQKATQLREEALKKGRTQDARWTLLESIKQDPSKRMGASKFDEE